LFKDRPPVDLCAESLGFIQQHRANTLDTLRIDAANLALLEGQLPTVGDQGPAVKAYMQGLTPR
jgi:hypothetical protein